jgi:hypothetical protein
VESSSWGQNLSLRALLVARKIHTSFERTFLGSLRGTNATEFHRLPSNEWFLVDQDPDLDG